MNILDEIKKQVEVEMKKIKKTQSSPQLKSLTQQQKNQLTVLTNQGILLKDAAKELNITFHEAKIAYNESKRKASLNQSDTETQIPQKKRAIVTKRTCCPQNFSVQTVVNGKLTSVRRLFVMRIQNP